MNWPIHSECVIKQENKERATSTFAVVSLQQRHRKAPQCSKLTELQPTDIVFPYRVM